MPIYEYQCTECGALHEALQKLSDAPLTDCPACGQSGLRKKISAAAFRLKGSGWYETDFKSGNKKNLAGDSSSESGKSGGDSAPSGASASKNTDGGAKASSSKDKSSGSGAGSSAA